MKPQRMKHHKGWQLEPGPWLCDDCEWAWPFAGGPPGDPECSDCGGRLASGDRYMVWEPNEARGWAAAWVDHRIMTAATYEEAASLSAAMATAEFPAEVQVLFNEVVVPRRTET